MLKYKNLPLVRNETNIFFGDPEKGEICHLQIKSEKEITTANGKRTLKIPTEIDITKVDCTNGMNFLDKKATRTSISEALDLAEVWLRQPTPRG